MKVRVPLQSGLSSVLSPLGRCSRSTLLAPGSLNFFCGPRVSVRTCEISHSTPESHPPADGSVLFPGPQLVLAIPLPVRIAPQAVPLPVGRSRKALRGKTLAECTELFKEARKADPALNGLEARPFFAHRASERQSQQPTIGG